MSNIFKDDTMLLPAVIQDDKTLKVLMLGYMNRESYLLSVSTQLVTFYSRSRKELWVKGETSGNFLKIVKIETDCDQDTLLIRVTPQGPVCHTGTTSCFPGEDSEGFIRKLTDLIKSRHALMPEGSYTTYLFNAGTDKIAKKLGEECAETIIEAVKGDKKRLVYEISDLIYHLIVLAENCGVTLQEIEQELYGRS